MSKAIAQARYENETIVFGDDDRWKDAFFIGCAFEGSAAGAKFWDCMFEECSGDLREASVWSGCGVNYCSDLAWPLQGTRTEKCGAEMMLTAKCVMPRGHKGKHFGVDASGVGHTWKQITA